ncbi:MAG: restriction endonuclease subunit S [Lachnospiraceae bacterium]|nr:restriction endonuclease subunit S [Lachnospiraceae bacterium]
MSKWEEKRLEDIIDVNPSVKLTKGISYPFIDIDKVSSAYRSVTNEEVKTYDGQSSSKFCDGDTVFSRITPCLENRKIAKVSIDGDVAFGSTEFYVFRAKEKKADARFIYYLASSDIVVLPAINSMTGASGRQRADKRFIKRLKLNLPDFRTQERIADILSAYDDLIEANNRRIKLLEQIAQELYQEWFVRFRFPGYEGVKFINGLPKGWRYGKFKNELNYITGKLDSNAAVPDGEYCFYTCAKTVYKTNSFCFDGECVLLGGNNATGDFSLFYANEKLDAYQRTYIVTPQNTLLSCAYIYFVLKDYLLQFKTASIGATTKFLTKGMLDKAKIVVPDKQIILQYNRVTKNMFEQIVSLKKGNENLAVQRDMLLPRLMSGKLEV